MGPVLSRRRPLTNTGTRSEKPVKQYWPRILLNHRGPCPFPGFGVFPGRTFIALTAARKNLPSCNGSALNLSSIVVWGGLTVGMGLSDCDLIHVLNHFCSMTILTAIDISDNKVRFAFDVFPSSQREDLPPFSSFSRSATIFE